MKRSFSVQRLVVFMITLILLYGCKEELDRPILNPDELAAYEQYMLDYDSPRFKWGYLDNMGQLLIKNQFDDCRDFSQGLAAVCKNGLWGCINTIGQFIVEPRHRAIFPYSDGLGLMYTLDGKYLFLDRNGQVAIDTLPYKEVYPFADGLARVGSKGAYGFIDTAGNLVMETNLELATNYDKGYAIVSTDRKISILDITGRVIFTGSDEIDKIYPISDGIFRYKADNKYGFYDPNGNKLLKATHQQATDFEGGRAAIFDGYKWGLLDKSGAVTTLPFTEVKKGGEGKWIYRSDTKYGYLRNDGSSLTMPNFQLATRFQDGLAGVEVAGLWGYVDDLGHMAISPTYPLVWDFKEGRARMINQDGFGFIDKKGQFIIPPYYLEVRDFSEGLARVQIFRS